MSDTVRHFISALATGISRAQMYSHGHETVADAAARLHALLETLPGGSLGIMVVEGELVVDNVLLRKPGLHGEKLVRQFGAKGISRVDFLEGVTVEELGNFVADMAEARGDLGRYGRIRAGTMRLRLASRDLLAGLDLSAFTEEQLGRLKSVYATVAPFRELEVAALEEIVANFLVTFRRGASVLKMISPVKSHSSYTYTHAMNVAVLSMSQAEHLGLADEVVQELGIAALMHDVGKLFVPQKILHKEGGLSAGEFADVKRHTILGAAYLTKVENMPRLAPVVALEHHRRYDGTGYPVLRDNGRRQHAASQLVAISDYYDALRSNRPYRKSLSVEEILSMMQKGAGRDFNPSLIGNFVEMLMGSL